MRAAVVVTGIGAATAVGPDVATTWAALIRGESGVARSPALVEAGMAVTMGGRIPGPREDEPFEHEHEIARAAIDEALRGGGVEAGTAAFVWACGLDAISLSVGVARIGSGMLFDRLAERFAWPRRRIATACSSSAQAVVEAMELLRLGRVTACLVGGSSAMLTPFYVHGLSILGVLAPDRISDDVCRPFDRHRSGTALGDGAAAMVLETGAHARDRGATILAEVLGAGTSMDAHDYFKPPRDGAGAALAIRRALDDAGIGAAELSGVFAHATGTVDGDLAEAAALVGLEPRLAAVPVSAIKGAVGHTMMAAGALGAVAGVCAVVESRLPPSANLTLPDPDCRLDHVIGIERSLRPGPLLVNSFGMGGHNVALVLDRHGGCA